MKLLHFLCALLFSTVALAAQPTNGQYVLQQFIGSGYKLVPIDHTSGTVIGFDGSGNPTLTTPFNGAFTSLSGRPTTLAGYGISDPVVLTNGTYVNPAFISSLAWSKITSTPSTLTGYAITDAVGNARTVNGHALSADVTVTFSDLGSKPTTLSGFGITDAVTTARTINGHALSGDVTVTFSDLGSKPTTISGFGITDGVTTARTVAGHPLSADVSVAFADLTSKPTTLSGYGITDAVANTIAVNGHALSSNVTVSASDVGLSALTNDAQLKASDLDTDGTLAANSDSKVPSQKAVKTYVDGHAGGGSGTALLHAYWVDQNGDDTTGDGSPGKPYATAQKAYTVGTVTGFLYAIHLGAGTSWTINTSGASANLAIFGEGASLNGVVTSVTVKTGYDAGTDDVTNANGAAGGELHVEVHDLAFSWQSSGQGVVENDGNQYVAGTAGNVFITGHGRIATGIASGGEVTATNPLTASGAGAAVNIFGVDFADSASITASAGAAVVGTAGADGNIRITKSILGLLDGGSIGLTAATISIGGSAYEAAATGAWVGTVSDRGGNSTW